MGDAAETLRSVIARGYRPAANEPPDVPWVVHDPQSGWRSVALPEVTARVDGRGRPVLLLVLPTYVGRAAYEDQAACVRRLLEQLADDGSGLVVLLVVGMQWGPGEAAEAYSRLERLGDLARREGLGYAGIALPHVGKRATLNAAFALGRRIDCVGAGWIDDDVVLAPGCLAALLRRFTAAGACGAVGARKIGHARNFRASRVLHWAKGIAKTPARGYPHGCCMIVDADCVAAGVPSRYVCEDDYFCFRLLAPQTSRPLGRLTVVQEAVCHHTVGGPTSEIYRRIRRSLFTAHVLQADFPAPVASYYLRSMQFYGLWPLSELDRSRGPAFAAVKWVVKAVYFAWFLEVGAELFVRGLVNRPMRRIAWSPYRGYARPSAP
jgi:hypothetical protein